MKPIEKPQKGMAITLSFMPCWSMASVVDLREYGVHHATAMVKRIQSPVAKSWEKNQQAALIPLA